MAICEQEFLVATYSSLKAAFNCCLVASLVSNDSTIQYCNKNETSIIASG